MNHAVISWALEKIVTFFGKAQKWVTKKSAPQLEGEWL
jgi:hypothetical protein